MAWRGVVATKVSTLAMPAPCVYLGFAAVEVFRVFPHNDHVDRNVVEPRGPRQLELLRGADVRVEIEQASHGLVGRRERLAVDLKILAWVSCASHVSASARACAGVHVRVRVSHSWAGREMNTSKKKETKPAVIIVALLDLCVCVRNVQWRYLCRAVANQCVAAL